MGRFPMETRIEPKPLILELAVPKRTVRFPVPIFWNREWSIFYSRSRTPIWYWSLLNKASIKNKSGNFWHEFIRFHTVFWQIQGWHEFNIHKYYSIINTSQDIDSPICSEFWPKIERVEGRLSVKHSGEPWLSIYLGTLVDHNWSWSANFGLNFLFYLFCEITH